jgi:hypothetical protein
MRAPSHQNPVMVRLMERATGRVHVTLKRVIAPGLRLALRHFVYCFKERAAIPRSLGVALAMRFVVRRAPRGDRDTRRA